MKENIAAQHASILTPYKAQIKAVANEERISEALLFGFISKISMSGELLGIDGYLSDLAMPNYWDTDCYGLMGNFQSSLIWTHLGKINSVIFKNKVQAYQKKKWKILMR